MELQKQKISNRAKISKGILILVLIGLIFSGGNYLNPKVFALVADGGGPPNIESSAADLIVPGVGVYITVAKIVIAAFKENCGTGGGPANFGGRIKKICACKKGGAIVKIGGPMGGNYYFDDSSIAFLFSPPKLNVWTVGLAGETKTCYDLLKKPKPMSGSKIKIMGTSML